MGYMCLHLLLGPASSSRIFRVFYQQNSLPALSIVKNVSHARKTDFSHEKPVALCILVIGAGGPTDRYFAGILSVGHSFSINPAKNGGSGGPSAGQGRGCVTQNTQQIIEI